MWELPWTLRMELHDHALTLGWMDDVIRAYRGTLSRGAKRAIQRLGAPTMYSDDLQLARTWSNAAFGFHWTSKNGALSVQQVEKRAQDFVANRLIRLGTPLYSATQSDSRKMHVGILYGYIFSISRAFQPASARS